MLAQGGLDFQNRRPFQVLCSTAMAEDENKKAERCNRSASAKGLFKQGIDGTSGRTRTGTPSLAGDFESPVSTNFTTLALRLKCCIKSCYGQ